MTRTLTTEQAAWMLGLPPASFARWARERGVEPLHTVRVGRSTVTAWDPVALGQASAPAELARAA